MGFELFASEGTSDFIRERGLQVKTLYSQGSVHEPKVVPVLKRKELDLVINIPSPGGHHTGEHAGVPCPPRRRRFWRQPDHKCEVRQPACPVPGAHPCLQAAGVAPVARVPPDDAFLRPFVTPVRRQLAPSSLPQCH
eukprot:TRINITY_DN430_c0_g1_i1.p1 TRINITY_DN430_c0_g1~~TRINITY_DN430_c0_g1_i1.p1  ORF type:complete len:155 (-),score=19.63 TRINITY_DN430_c0_g1_i1:490-900(-)